LEQIAARDKCSVRQVNMTISLAFLAPWPARRSCTQLSLMPLRREVAHQLLKKSLGKALGEVEFLALDLALIPQTLEEAKRRRGAHDGCGRRRRQLFHKRSLGL
jgi:hypothetical protein